MIRRRAVPTFNLSFLDVICCGFGAIILLFVLTIGSRERIKIETLTELTRALAAEMEEIYKLRADQEALQRKQQSVATLVADERKTNEVIHALLDEHEKQLQLQKAGEKALLVDMDALKKEIAARQKKAEIESILPDVPPAPVGLNISGNYIAIVIDTSGSMRDPHTGGLWPIAIRKIGELLDSYPQLKGLQLLDGDGRFIMGRPGRMGTEAWIKDSPETRDQIVRTLRRYNQDSVSDPVPGTRAALRYLHDPENPEMKMVVYIFGDEFIGIADPAIRQLDALNPADENGNRKIVINAIGFPTVIRYHFSMGNTGIKFANLMRTVCYMHGGTFIALQDL